LEALFWIDQRKAASNGAKNVGIEEAHLDEAQDPALKVFLQRQILFMTLGLMGFPTSISPDPTEKFPEGAALNR